MPKLLSRVPTVGYDQVCLPCSPSRSPAPHPYSDPRNCNAVTAVEWSPSVRLEVLSLPYSSHNRARGFIATALPLPRWEGWLTPEVSRGPPRAGNLRYMARSSLIWARGEGVRPGAGAGRGHPETQPKYQLGCKLTTRLNRTIIWVPRDL